MANSKTGDTFVPVTQKSNPMAPITKGIPADHSKSRNGSEYQWPGQDLIPSRPGYRRASGKPLLRPVKSRRETGFPRPLKNITTALQTGKGICPLWQDPPGSRQTHAACCHKASAMPGISEVLAGRTGLTADRTLPDEDGGREIRFGVYFNNA